MESNEKTKPTVTVTPKPKKAPRPVIETLNPKTLGQEHSAELFKEFAEEDDMGQRVVTVEGRTFKLRLKNPYNVFEIVSEHGQLPMEMRGSFTTKRAAEDAIKQYLARTSTEGSVAKNYHEDLLKKGF